MLFTSVPQNTANYWYTAKTARLDGKPVEHNSNSLAQTNFKKISKLCISKAAKR
jgi:hypothetical protein